ncbi:hypothetical protein PROFUN_09784 [Planoprotostelium fungivorum]|uniref:Signal recognition particle 19 kDa protein n=1 Tax=Planoprotostelium fungivorum TaxID=1890364 RepID=A0A2P6NGM1_9EUKA|nr:hypothetical protein PROFUN_09784 [Planoprotostelium fungivorum]
MSDKKKEPSPTGKKTIYPVYINSKKKISEGRRIAVAKCCENPSPMEIHDVCKHLGFKVEMQADKAYSRDATQRGRVIVHLKDASGKLIDPTVENKGDILEKVASLIPKLQSRSSTDNNHDRCRWQEEE